jgi:hypothetical protein
MALRVAAAVSITQPVPPPLPRLDHRANLVPEKSSPMAVVRKRSADSRHTTPTDAPQIIAGSRV